MKHSIKLRYLSGAAKALHDHLDQMYVWRQSVEIGMAEGKRHCDILKYPVLHARARQ